MNDYKAIEEFYDWIASDCYLDAPSNDACKLAISAIQEREERGNGCEYCNDTVIDLRRIDCIDCTESQDGEMCGKLKKCPPSENDWYYEHVFDNEHNFCPICGRPLKGEEDGKDS